MIIMRLKHILLILTLFIIQFAKPFDTLSRYCSTLTDNSPFISTFKSCYAKVELDYESASLLDQVMVSFESSTSNSTGILIDLVRLIQLANTQTELRSCLKSACGLFTNCEFPIDSKHWNDFETEASAASRLASLLTGLMPNEDSDSKSLLKNLHSLLEFTLLDNVNIYECKIIFKDSNYKNLDLQATKSFRDKTLDIASYNIENSNLNWYRKWFVETKSVSFAKKSYKLKSDTKSVASHPTTDDYNSIRFLSNVSYDCLNSVWKRVVSVPFLYPTGDIRGIAVISISLNNFDLKQCGTAEIQNNKTFTDLFYNSHKCDRETTECVDLKGKGFVLDAYDCKCRPGYYNNTSVNGSKPLSCLKCSEGCDTCIDDKPCITDVPIYYKQIALIINMTCIVLCIVLLFLTWYNMSLNMLKTSSVKMLLMVLLGSIVSYSELIPMYFAPNYWTCTAAQILQLEGFLLAYGALVLKTWRECKLFYVRSIRTIKITEKSLMKRLGIIMAVGTVYLMIWSIRKVDSPKEIEVYDTNNLMYKMCSITEWNFISMAIQGCVLLWGVVLSIQVGRASISFKETKLISWSIFNECVVTCFVVTISVLIKNTKVSVYVPFFLSFVRIHLQITVMILLLFSYKMYTVILSRKKPFQSNQSNLLNFSGSLKDGDQKNSSANEETEKERELKLEIQRLYRQIEEMRSLSMRIANLHLLTKKSRFIAYPTKKLKSSKTKNFLLPENETTKPMDSVDIVAEKIYGKLKTIDEDNEKLNSIQMSRPKSKNK